MNSVIVTTKEELEQAANNKTAEIIVRGEFAEKLNTSLKIKKLSKWVLALLVASLCAIPVTGGVSTLAVAPVAAFTGLEIVTIIAVATIGVSLVLMIAKDYKKVSFRAKNGDKEAEMVLERDE